MLKAVSARLKTFDMEPKKFELKYSLFCMRTCMDIQLWDNFGEIRCYDFVHITTRNYAQIKIVQYIRG